MIQRNDRFSFATRTTSRGILALAVSGAIAAQSASAAEPSGVEEITVTARRVEERLQTTGVSVAAFSAARIDALKIETAADLAKYTPNLVLQSRGGNASNGLVLKIRGLGVSDIDYLTSDPSVAVYIDGIFQARAFGPQFELFDLERIEVLRGPQGTLYGKNALGGAINIITGKPTGQNKAAFDVTVGDYGRLDFAGRADMSLVKDKLSASVAATSRTHDGYYKNTYLSGLDPSDENVQAARLALRWTPSDMITVDITGDYTRQRQHPAAYFLAAFDPAKLGAQAAAARGMNLNNYLVGPAPSSSQLERTGDDYGSGVGSFLPSNRGARGRAESNADFRGASMTVTAEFSPDLTLRSLTSYRDFDRFSTQDLDATPVPIADFIYPSSGDQVTQELQLNARLFDNRLNIVLGGFVLRENLSEDQMQGFVLGLADTNPANRSLSARVLRDLQNTALAAFTHAILNVTDKLRVTAGVRYGWEKKDANYRAGQLQTEGVFQTMVANASRTFNSVTPKFGVEYEITDDLFTYGTVSKGYASGGYVARVNVSAGGIESYNPESLWSYEIGAKATWFDHTLRTNVAAFRMDYENIVVQSFGASPDGRSIGSFTKNAGSATVQGIEADIEWRPVSSLLLTAGIGVLDQKFNDFGIGANGQPIDPKAAHFFDSPARTQNIAAQYTLPIAQQYGTLAVGADWSHRSRIYFDNATPPVVSSQAPYSLISARVSFESLDQRLKVTLFGENLGDRVYAIRTSNLLASPYGVATVGFGAPRTFGARMSYKL